MSDALTISLPRFAGPLDLLLELVRKNQVDIADIPIAEITRQYLAYMQQAAQLDMNLGADFTYMAATLIQLKARSLLPSDPELVRREPDPRQDLVRQLLDHAQVKQAAEFLQQQLEVAGAIWTRTADEVRQASEENESSPVQAGFINLLDLVRLAKKAVETARTHEILQFDQDEVSLEEMISWLQPRLATLGPTASLPCDHLFQAQPDRRHQVALFLAILELSKLGNLRVEQSAIFGQIHLYRTTVP